MEGNYVTRSQDEERSRIDRARAAEASRRYRLGDQPRAKRIYRRGDEKELLLVVCWCESTLGEMPKADVARGETFSCDGGVRCKDRRKIPVPVAGWV